MARSILSKLCAKTILPEYWSTQIFQLKLVQYTTYSSLKGSVVPSLSAMIVERQPPCPRATTILAGFEAAEVGVSFGVLG